MGKHKCIDVGDAVDGPLAAGYLHSKKLEMALTGLGLESCPALVRAVPVVQCLQQVCNKKERKKHKFH